LFADMLESYATQYQLDRSVSDAIPFFDWVLKNCELEKEMSCYKYEGEDYDLEGVYQIFKHIYQSNLFITK
jgi:hypothetical protein